MSGLLKKTIKRMETAHPRSKIYKNFSAQKKRKQLISISIKDGGVLKVISQARETVAPTYFSVDYRPRLDHRGYSEMYLIECSASGT